MAPSPPISLSFTVQRKKPELVAPAIPTPHEHKQLSDIDDQEGLRFQIPFIQFYHNDPSMEGKDPVDVIRKALSKALVYYYPFAGRLREGANKKLMVDCTGEGVLFIEAEADVRLQQFGDALQPPFPLLEELLYDVPGSGEILHSPLLLVQVTRLECGGFIFAVRLNHTMADASGISQFMGAVGEIARGAEIPSIQPVWCRDLLNSRFPPRVTCIHHEYEEVGDTEDTIVVPLDQMVHRSFFFGPTEISILKKSIPSHLGKCSTFELLLASIWRCRTIALQPADPEEQVRVMFAFSARSKLNPPLPSGYYGNTFVMTVVESTAKELEEKPLGYAVELVKKTKDSVSEERMRSLVDLMVVAKGRPHFKVVRSFVVSNVMHAGAIDVDFGWGRPTYGGPANGGFAPIPGMSSFYLPFKNDEGENGVVVPICLPDFAMDRFELEMDKLLEVQSQPPDAKEL